MNDEEIEKMKKTPIYLGVHGVVRHEEDIGYILKDYGKEVEIFYGGGKIERMKKTEIFGF